MSKDMIVQEDNYTGTMNERYQQIGREVDAVVAQYVQILFTLSGENMEGKAAEKLFEFAQETERLLGGMLEPEVTECAQKQIKFIEEIELEDK